MDIFQKSITPDKPRVLAEEQIYVYVPMATSTNAGIASYNKDQFDVIGSEVSLKWPTESFAQGPIETPSIVKVLDNEFEYTGNLVDLISGNNKISSDKLEVQLKRILRDAYERPELVMLDPNYFVRTIVEKDGKQYYKYNTTAVHYNMPQTLSEDEQAQARQNISASSISDNEATNQRIDALLQTGVYSINGKTGNVILTTSDIENNSGYTTIDFVNSSIATNTATFRGTYNSLAELEAYTGEKDNNDYAFVIEIDAAGNTLYNRYKYVDNKWTFEYTLNNSSFTEAQWAAINSGITDSIIETVRTNITNLQNDKVSKIDGKGLSTNDFTDAYKLQVENNTVARHKHDNKALLDTYTQTETNLADAVNKKHIHDNKALLDTYTQTETNLADAVNKKHVHNNKEILDGITASYTTEEKAKLNGIASGAEVNVQADWAQTDSSSKDYIKNKPLIPEGVKLYSSTGENTDGAMTQKAVTDEFKNNAPVVFAESERQKSKNLFNAEVIPITSDNVTYDKDTNTFTYTINSTIESSDTAFAILKYGKLKPGTYTMSFNTTSTIGNTSPVIVAKLNEHDNFSTSIAIKNIIDGYVYLTFTLNEETNIGLTWYYKAGWISGDAPPGVKTLTNLQLEEGTVATDYRPYNGAIVHEKQLTEQLTEQLSGYLPLAGGTLTGKLKLGNGVAISDINDNTILTHYTDNKNYFGHTDFESVIRGSKITIANPLTISNKSFNYSAIEQGSDNADRIVWFSDNTTIGKPVYNNNFKYNPSTNILKVGSLSLTSVPKVNGVNVALLSDLNSYLPLSGGTMTEAILFSDNATYSSTTQPTALSYGRLQAYGTLNINGNTDNSGIEEYVNITAGHGCSSSTADGLSVGTDTLTWKGQPVVHSGNIGTYGVEGKTFDYISSKYLRFCQLQTNVGSDFSFATFLITAGGDFGDKFVGTYLVTIGTRGGTDGSIKVLCLQKPSLPSSFKFGYRVNPDDSNRVDYFMYGATHNFFPIKVICLTKGGGYQVNTDLVEIAEPSSYTTASYNGDIECGSINLIV